MSAATPARVAVVVGNPKPRSRTYDAALQVAERIGGADLVVDLADVAGELFDPASEQVTALVEQVSSSLVVIVASPTYKATYTGLLKAFLDRFPHQGLGGVSAVPLMLGASAAHSLAPEFGLRQVLVELGASVPTRGLYVLESDAADPEAYDAWYAAAAPYLPTLAAIPSAIPSAQSTTQSTKAVPA